MEQLHQSAQKTRLDKLGKQKREPVRKCGLGADLGGTVKGTVRAWIKHKVSRSSDTVSVNESVEEFMINLEASDAGTPGEMSGLLHHNASSDKNLASPMVSSPKPALSSIDTSHLDSSRLSTKLYDWISKMRTPSSKNEKKKKKRKRSDSDRGGRRVNKRNILSFIVEESKNMAKATSKVVESAATTVGTVGNLAMQPFGFGGDLSVVNGTKHTTTAALVVFLKKENGRYVFWLDILYISCRITIIKYISTIRIPVLQTPYY